MGVIRLIESALETSFCLLCHVVASNIFWRIEGDKVKTGKEISGVFYDI